MTCIAPPELKAFLLHVRDAARAVTLPAFAASLDGENKAADGSYDPVTEADRGAEQAIRALVEQRWPDDSISGEEFGIRAGTTNRLWSLDPIDGTRAFVSGLASWTTLVGVLDEGRAVAGMIDVPRLDETYLAAGAATLLIDAVGERALRASACDGIAGARLATTDPFLFTDNEAAAFDDVRRRARITRYGLDAYAYARLAAGTIDLVIESGLKTYDYDALVPVVRGAGGVIGNWRGEDEFGEGKVVAAATRKLFDEAVALLSA